MTTDRVRAYRDVRGGARRRSTLVLVQPSGAGRRRAPEQLPLHDPRALRRRLSRCYG